MGVFLWERYPCTPSTTAIQGLPRAAVEREGNTSNCFQDVCTDDGSQVEARNLALADLFVTRSQKTFVLKTALKSRPESSLDWLVCCKFARQPRTCPRLQGYLPHKKTHPPWTLGIGLR